MTEEAKTPTDAGRIAPCLWFNGEAEAAARFYMSLFPGSEILALSRYGAGAPFPAGTAMMVEFSLAGQRFQALNGGPDVPHSAAISLSIDCADQAETDRLWDGLLAGGGKPGRCGWLKDRFGVSWQVVPRGMSEFIGGPSEAGRARALSAMMRMSKLDLGKLEDAYDDEPVE